MSALHPWLTGIRNK